MIKINNIRIYLLYTSGYGRVASFYNLNNDTATMEIEDYNAEYFWNVGGGLRVVLNEYYTIFYSTSFNYVLDCIYFLMDSIYFVSGRYSNCRYFLDTNELDQRVLFRTALNEYVTVINSSAELFSLSYVQGEYAMSSSRGDFYFNDLLLNRQLWIDAALVAIREFQFQLEEVLTHTSVSINEMGELNKDLKRILTEYTSS